MNYLIELILKLGKVDRRWIFLIIGLVVLLPLIYPISLPIRATVTTKQVYDTVDALEPNSKILLWSNNGYYLDRDYIYAIGFITNMADSGKIYDQKQVIGEMKNFGITHVAMTDNDLRKKLKDVAVSTDGIKILYQDRKMMVAALIE